MKRYILTVVVLFIFYFGIQVFFRFNSAGFTNEYTIKDGDKEFQVVEQYIANTEGETDSYNLTITNGENVYNYSLYQNLNKMGKIIEDIKSNGSCIYPIFRNDKQYFDITCLSENVQIYYHDMNASDEIKAFAENLKQYGYNATQFVDSAKEDQLEGNASFYKSNINENHYVGIQNYRGLYTISKFNPNKIYNNQIFDTDIYNPSLSTLISHYYIVADYEGVHNFNTIYAINLKNNNVEKISNPNLKISFDSYIQGTVDNSAYLFDPSNIKQYEIDIKSMSITEVGNEETKILYYQDGQWSRVNAYDAVNTKLYFNSVKPVSQNESWDYEIKVGGDLTGFTYYFKKEGNVYKVYKTNGQSDVLTYLFDTFNLNSIKYVSDYVYFISGPILYYYNDATGVRRLYKNNELQFNENLKFYIYK